MCFISNTNICLCHVGGEIRSKWNLLDDSDVLDAAGCLCMSGIAICYILKIADQLLVNGNTFTLEKF